MHDARCTVHGARLDHHPHRTIPTEDYHRALFAVSCDELRQEIQWLTGRKVREAAVVVEPASGAIVHAFTSGTMVQIFQLEPHGVSSHMSAGTSDDDATSS